MNDYLNENKQIKFVFSTLNTNQKNVTKTFFQFAIKIYKRGKEKKKV